MNRTALFLAVAAFESLVYLIVDINDPTMRLFIRLILAMLWLLFIQHLVDTLRILQRLRKRGSIFDRLDRAHAVVRRIRPLFPAVRKSAGRALWGHRGIEQAADLAMIVVAMGALLTAVPATAGIIDAKTGEYWYVTQGTPRLVAVDRFGDRIVAARLDERGQRFLPGFVLVPVGDRSNVWARRELGRLSTLKPR